jgi:transposase
MKKKQKNKPILLQREVSVPDLKSEIKKTTDERYKTHLRAILLFHEGKTKTEVAQILIAGRRTVYGWVTAYNQKGKEGLKTKPTGRPKGKRKWENQIFEDLAKEIDVSEKYWSIPLMVKWIEKNKKKTIPEQTIWYRMTQIRYSHKSSRPYPYKGDKEKQEVFKKGGS